MHDEDNAPITDDIDALADAIATSAATADAAMHTLLSNIRRFDALKGWARQGAKTCAHWLSWRIGDGIVAAREKVRVARALGGLALVDEALKDGSISYAKVRAITRVAKPQMEALLLHYAKHSTGAQLEKICRGYRQVERTCESGRKALPDDERYVRRKNVASGMVRIEAQLTADEADIVFRALEHARTKEQTQADALIVMAESVLAHGPRARSGGARNQIFVHLSKDDVENASAEAPWRATLADGNWLSGQALLRLACDAGIVVAKVDRDGSVLDVGRRQRSVPPAILRALRIRDGGCRFPGCTHRAWVDAHHIEHWAHGGATSLENMVLLCSAHHRAVHEGGFRIDRYGDGSLMFIEPSGDILDDVPTPLPLRAPAQKADPRVNRPRTQRMNFPWAVQGLVDRAGLTRSQTVG
jgi:hypothetical protein